MLELSNALMITSQFLAQPLFLTTHTVFIHSGQVIVGAPIFSQSTARQASLEPDTAYFPLEVARSEELRADGLSDTWLFGSVIFMLLFEKYPEMAEIENQTLFVKNRLTNSRIQHILHGCLQIAPADRIDHQKLYQLCQNLSE